MSYSIWAYKVKGELGEKGWCGGIWEDGIHPVADSAEDGDDGWFSTKCQALAWARAEKRKLVDSGTGR